MAPRHTPTPEHTVGCSGSSALAVVGFLSSNGRPGMVDPRGEPDSVVSRCATLNVAYLIGEMQILAVNHALARSTLDGSSRGCHGTFHQAVQRSLSLLRSHCHPRLFEWSVTPRAGRILFSP